jgi:hypothetical protein
MFRLARRCALLATFAVANFYANELCLDAVRPCIVLIDDEVGTSGNQESSGIPRDQCV